MELAPLKPDTQRFGKGCTSGATVAEPGIGMHGVVILHPIVSGREGGGGIRDRADPDVVALEGFLRKLRPCRCFPGFQPG